jgi:hypothetical protein
MTAGSAARKPLMAGNCGANPGDNPRTPGHSEGAV